MHWEPPYPLRRVSLRVAERRGCAASFFGHRDSLLTPVEKAARSRRNQVSRGREPTASLPLNNRNGDRIFPGTTLVGSGLPRMKRWGATRKAPWGARRCGRASAGARGVQGAIGSRVNRVARGKVARVFMDVGIRAEVGCPVVGTPVFPPPGAFLPRVTGVNGRIAWGGKSLGRC